MPEHEVRPGTPETPDPGETAAAEAAEREGSGYAEISVRTMLLLGGVSTVVAVAILGLTLLVGPGGNGGGTAGSPPPDASVPRAPVSGAAQGPPVAVPAVAGLDVAAAVNRLAVRRIPLGGVIRVPSSRNAGLVVRSYPRGGTVVQGGAPVTLYVSAGMGGSVAGGEVTVPYLVGLDEQRARGTAAALGLRVAVEGSGAAVAAQRPAPGSVLPRDGTVTLTLR
ncbi:PASTA domain-containing protein [Spirillospora sp. NPDC029432]|uniref:PASTA domain-containing protein n=1 Tax=Spirillospora sp. NPDC029432 TaxID=3154599 RepID=UPI003452A953